MDTDDNVRRALSALAEADAARGAPQHAEQALLDAFDRQARHRSAPRLLIRACALAAALALLALTMTAYRVLSGRGASGDEVQPAHEAIGRESRPPFEQVSMTPPATGDPIGQTLQIRVPRSMLPRLGVPIIEPDAPGTVTIKLVVGEDGLARTIRVLQ
jgi:hypothetical protein